MQTDILEKYNVPVPRYTSYPPANYFRDFTEDEYLEAIQQSDTAADGHVSFYLHMPFCRHLCHYCACNSYAMGNAEKTDRYLDALHREIDLMLPLISRERHVSQIHYGGGSPTAVAPLLIKWLNEHLTSLPHARNPGLRAAEHGREH